MLEERLKGEATGTEWRRSRSGVPDASGAAADEDISGAFEEMPGEEPAAVGFGFLP